MLKHLLFLALLPLIVGCQSDVHSPKSTPSMVDADAESGGDSPSADNGTADVHGDTGEKDTSPSDVPADTTEVTDTVSDTNPPDAAPADTNNDSPETDVAPQDTTTDAPTEDATAELDVPAEVEVDIGPVWDGTEPTVTPGIPSGLPPALALPQGRVPLAIAVGNGRIVTSCDRGQTWVQDTIIDPDASDHSEYSMFITPAYGNGAMVIGSGWGYPGHTLRSENGIDWEDVSGDHFSWLDGTTHPLTGSIGALYFDGSKFVLVSNRRVFYSPDGRDWTEQDLEIAYSYFHWREMSYVPQLNRLFMRGQSINPAAEWLFTSEDALATLTHVEVSAGFDFNCGGHASVGHGAIMISQRGSEDPNVACKSTDGGATWSVHTAEATPARIFPTAAGWAGVRGWRKVLYTSVDGQTWEQQPMAGFTAVTGARSPHGYYVLASRQNEEFRYSEDGATWSAAPSMVIEETNRVRSFGFGHGAPSALCPL